ncbi:hypothetical protein JOF53_002227 [Crossiella equi]|uniref:Uncharacterized protein n=1 Tax=Crossiella equi TaxID=130796 RepID=A0ABS5A9U2_9PSEU|nr:hypothetical protein [Crossiella equi]MBP2473355.1 hypothetical protein [Crossiella equi]
MVGILAARVRGTAGHAPAQIAQRLTWQGFTWAVIPYGDRLLRKALAAQEIRVFLECPGDHADPATLVETAERLGAAVEDLLPEGIAIRTEGTLTADAAATLQTAAEEANPAIEVLVLSSLTPDFAALDDYTDHYAIPGATEGTKARTLRTVLTCTPESGEDVDGVLADDWRMPQGAT